MRFCKNTDCDVVYFQSDQIFHTEDINKLVYQKSDNKDRYVCYCFKHSVKSIRQEILESGGTSVYEEISEKCKKGLDACSKKNPQGSCCLGNVKAVIVSAMSDFDIDDEVELSDCASCCSKKDDSEAGKTVQTKGVKRTTLLALISAFFSSSCCWLPLLFVVFGGSSLGFSTIMDKARLPLLVLAVLSLSLSFYYIYIRKSSCGTKTRFSRMNEIGFWVSLILVLMFGIFPAFPSVVFMNFVNSANAEVVNRTTINEITSRSFRIEGMTCEGCSKTLEMVISKVPGVKKVRVSYPLKTAIVEVDASFDDKLIVEAAKEAGYSATLVSK